MADPKSTYFATGNRGFATVLDRAEQGSFFDSALRVAARKKQAADKEQSEIMDMLSPEDVWQPFSETANQLILNGIESLAKGDLNRVDAMKLSAQYKMMQSQAKGLQEQHKEATKNYAADDEIDEAWATQWRFNKIVGDGSAEHLSKIAKTGVEDNGWVNEWGGSKAFKVNKVVSGLVGDLNKTLTDFIGSEQKSYPARGAIRFTKENMSVLVNEAFDKGVDKDGNPVIKVKNVEALRENGLLDSFLDDRRFHRIVMDSLYDKSGGQKKQFTNDEIDQEAVKLISLYGSDQQELKIKDESSNARYSVDSDRPKDDNVDAEQSMAIWYEHLQSGNQELVNNALNQLSNTRSVDGSLFWNVIANGGIKQLTGTKSDRDYVKEGSNKSGPKISQSSFRGATFDIIGSRINEYGNAVLTVKNNDLLKTTDWTTANISANRELEITLDPSANRSPEFWNEFYRLAMAGKEDKSHYNESKGGQLGGAVPTEPKAKKPEIKDPNNIDSYN